MTQQKRIHELSELLRITLRTLRNIARGYVLPDELDRLIDRSEALLKNRQPSSSLCKRCSLPACSCSSADPLQASACVVLVALVPSLCHKETRSIYRF